MLILDSLPDVLKAIIYKVREVKIADFLLPSSVSYSFQTCCLTALDHTQPNSGDSSFSYISSLRLTTYHSKAVKTPSR